jgi:hypothetical protein
LKFINQFLKENKYVIFQNKSNFFIKKKKEQLEVVRVLDKAGMSHRIMCVSINRNLKHNTET